MPLNMQFHVSIEYQRGQLTGAAMAYLTAVTAGSILTPFKEELERVIKNSLQLQGKEYSQDELLALLIIFCNEGYLPEY